ncbi:CBS domain-containing protein [Pelagibacterium xiamenense]|uniref:CBS domain-containing protein n=1 Tax=Pelagibacterium xiamenense TaxID=2901140 RepID=UPI001E4B45D0|nr:CBS domain-containing protein [Pelagibacterium xiamenense]MCD7059368.1 CBS domain-containing protein [Pelagibacterium xiamenense]
MTPPAGTIARYMTTDVISLAPDIEINRAIALLLTKRISGAPVLDRSRALVGILTKKDCFKAALNASYYQQWGGLVSDYMSGDVETLDAELDLIGAAQRFLTSTYRRFPVMREGEMVGLLSRTDLLRAFNAMW